VIETDGPYVVFRWPAWSEHPIIIMIGETEHEVRSVCPVDLENEDGWIYEGCTELGGNDPYLHWAVLDYARTLGEPEGIEG
jgi:hypothetical protein